MNWSGLTEFMSMGGYGLYVWGSYVVTATLMLIEPWLTLRQRRRALQDKMHLPSEN